MPYERVHRQFRLVLTGNISVLLLSVSYKMYVMSAFNRPFLRVNRENASIFLKDFYSGMLREWGRERTHQNDISADFK